MARYQASGGNAATAGYCCDMLRFRFSKRIMLGASKRLHRCRVCTGCCGGPHTGWKWGHAQNAASLGAVRCCSTEEASLWWYRYTPDADGDGVPDAIQNMTGRREKDVQLSREALLVPTIVVSVRRQVISSRCEALGAFWVFH